MNITDTAEDKSDFENLYLQVYRLYSTAVACGWAFIFTCIFSLASWRWAFFRTAVGHQPSLFTRRWVILSSNFSQLVCHVMFYGEERIRRNIIPFQSSIFIEDAYIRSLCCVNLYKLEINNVLGKYNRLLRNEWTLDIDRLRENIHLIYINLFCYIP